MLTSSDSQNHLRHIRQEAEGFVQSALDALSTHVVLLDEQCNIISTNEAWRTFADDNNFKSPDYGIGLNYLAVCDKSAKLNSKEAALVAQGIRDVLHGRIEEYELEYPCHSPTEQRWFIVRVSRFEWYGKFRFIIAHQNLTELKRVQLELGQSKQRLEAILDNINNGILTIDATSVITSANLAIERIFGYDIDSLIGMNIHQLIDTSFDGEMSFENLKGTFEKELTGIHREGTRFPLYFSINELHLSDGSVYTCIIQDITYLKQVETEIMERERVQIALEKERELRDLKNRFLSMMSHELRTPLTIIGLSYDSLKKYGNAYTEEERVQALDEIYNQTQYLASMVEDVMTLSRTESNLISMELKDVDFITYCRDVVEEFQFAYHKTHRIEFFCDEPIIRANIDRHLMRRPLTNLLSNAIKYSPDGGDVYFCLSLVDGYSVIKIKDSGIGIPEEDQPYLFEPFHRASNVGSLPGSGLGLPITKQTIDMHNGDIHFTSGTSGTTFTIRIPAH